MHRIRVLLAEDEHATRGTISLLLSAYGCVVHETEKPGEILPILERLDILGHPADLLILDAEMAGLGGLPALEELRAAGRGIPAILIVGLDPREAPRRSSALGRVVLLQKPFDPSRLEAAIREALNHD